MAFPKTVTAYYTVDEYLEIDRSTDERYEYVDGQIYLMAGESGEHGDICTNLVREISFQLKNKNCRVRSKDTKVKSGSLSKKAGQIMKGMFSFPDIVIICGEPEYHDKFRDIILNPQVIIEVLSDSTENFDRTDKFTRYRMFNPTLTDYVLISQDKPLIEHYLLQDDNSWKLFSHIGLEKIFNIESVGCSVNLLEIYDRIEFSDETHELLREITESQQ